MTPEYWYWENALNKKECKDIHNLIINSNHQKEKENASAHSVKTSKVLIIYWKDIKHKISHLLDNCYLVNNLNFGFHLYPMNETNNVLNYNIYSKDTEYDWHTDGSLSPIYDIKLTILINLSDKKYEGGEFLLNPKGNPVEVKELRNTGSMIMFPSHTLHKVNPIVKGERRTLAIFLDGPAFK